MASLDRVAERSLDEMLAALDEVRAAPKLAGALELIVERPDVEQRRLVEAGELQVGRGLAGDNWEEKPSSKLGRPNPEAEVTVMSSRAASLVADSTEAEAWAPAGDQLYADLDLSESNLPAGTRLEIGEAVLEVTAEPHLGCGKFVARYGVDAMKLVNSAEGRALRLRGVNTRVVRAGRIEVGDEVRKR